MGILVPKPMLGRQLPTGRARGLFGLWLLNEGSGNIVSDLSGNNKTGTIYGTAPSWTAGKFGSAVLLPGTDEYIDTGVSINTNENWAVVGWAKVVIKASGSTQFLFGSHQGNRYYFGFSSTGSYFLGYGDSFKNTTASDEITNNVWFHFAFFGDNGTARLYINAEEVDTHAYSGVGAQSKSNLIGARGGQFDPWLPADFTNCVIDHVMLYNPAPSASEIAELYLRSFAMFDRMPIELWVGATSVGVPPVGIQTYMHHYQQAS